MISALSPKNNTTQIFKSNSQARHFQSSNQGGASGSFFFFTQDKRLIVKTMTKEEKDLMLNISEAINDHFREKYSVLAKVYGIYRFRMKWGQNIFLMVMKNMTKKIEPKNKVIYTFDLKGSSINRGIIKSKHKNYGINKLKNLYVDSVLKDNDLVFIKNYKKSSIINISKVDKNRLMNAISADTMFLEKLGIMDYSLLISVEEKAIEDENLKSMLTLSNMS